MREAMDLLDTTEDTDKQTKAWSFVLSSAEQLDQEILGVEALADRKRQIKMASCTGL